MAVGRLSRSRGAVVRLARPDVRPDLRVRRRRRADDRRHRSQRHLRLRAVHQRAGRRPLHHQRHRRRADHQRLGTLRGLSAPARHRAGGRGGRAGPRPQARRLLQGRAARRPRRDHQRAPPAHRRRDRLLRSRAVRRAHRSRGARRVLLGLRRARGDERLSGSRPAQRRPRRRRLVLAAQPRPPGDGDGQLRQPPPDLQHRRLPPQLRQGSGRPARTDRSQGDRQRDQGAPRVLHHRPVRLAAGQRGHHRRSGAGARGEGARRGHGAGGPLGCGQPGDALLERRGGQALDRPARDRPRPLEGDLRSHHAARRLRRRARRRRSVDVTGGRRRQDVHRLPIRADQPGVPRRRRRRQVPHRAAPRAPL